VLQSLTGPSETCLRSPQRPRPSCFNPSQVRLKLEYVAESLAAVPALQSLTGPSETRRRQQFRRLQRGLQSLTGPSETVEKIRNKKYQSRFNPSQVRLKPSSVASSAIPTASFNPSQVRLKLGLGVVAIGALVLQSLTGPSETSPTFGGGREC